MTVTLIAAVARNRVIGADGAIPWHIPEDLARFKDTTMGHVLVMGRRTFESIGRALPGRSTIVVTRQPDWQFESVLTARSVDEALEQGGRLDDEVFVVGGGEIYEAAMPRASRLVISCVDAAPTGDVFFPEISEREWQEVSREDYDGWVRVTYERR
jgi:dihydrofolate reductase